MARGASFLGFAGLFPVESELMVYSTQVFEKSKAFSAMISL